MPPLALSIERATMRTRTTLSHQSGVVLLSVLMMLAIGSVWTSYAWQQTFAQQRMMQHQTLEALAWQAAETGAMQLVSDAQGQLGQPIATLQWPATAQQFNTISGTPTSRWRLHAPPHFDTASSTWWLHVLGEVVDATAQPVAQLAQAQLLFRISTPMSSDPTASFAFEWQRVYPR